MKLKLAAILFALLSLAVPGLSNQEMNGQNTNGRYGFYSVVEGTVTVRQGSDRFDLESNYPLMTGDQLWTSYQGRTEAILPDSTILRIGGNSVLTFDSLAFSSDQESEGTSAVSGQGGASGHRTQRLPRFRPDSNRHPKRDSLPGGTGNLSYRGPRLHQQSRGPRGVIGPSDLR